MQWIHAQDLDDIATGAAVLGTGGGGNPYIGKLIAREALQAQGPVAVVDIDDLPDNALVVPVAMMGAPTVGIEKLPTMAQLTRPLAVIAKLLGQPVTHTYAIEIGGSNSMLPLAVAAQLGIPIVNIDGMGRAFPEIQMVTHSLYGIASTPMVIVDEKGNEVCLSNTGYPTTETFARPIATYMGARASIALYPAKAHQLKMATIPGGLTLAADIGRAIRAAHDHYTSPVKAVATSLNGYHLFSGKVTDLSRKVEGGFARGVVQISDFEGNKHLTVEFQNEYLIARHGDTSLATTPDLIMILEHESGYPITTEQLRYGLRVAVVAAPCDWRWRTEAGLALVGPGYFGYDVPYVPIEEQMAGGYPFI